MCLSYNEMIDWGVTMTSSLRYRPRRRIIQTRRGESVESREDKRSNRTYKEINDWNIASTSSLCYYAVESCGSGA
jgi:hypothetical protein